jgi:hypothetical protein
LKKRTVFCFVVPREASYCPVCTEPLSLRGRKERGLIEGDGTKVILLIRRMYCAKCDRIHHELPDCCVPYKRHCADTFEKIIAGNADSVPCETETIRRILVWWEMMQPYFISILKSLAEKHQVPFSSTPAFKEIVRAVTNSNNWIFARGLCTRSVEMSE